MVSPDELERLSRFRSGDLEPAKRAAIEGELRARPELAEALARLGELDRIAAGLADGLEDEASERIVSRVLRPATQSSRRRLAGAVALASALALGLFFLGRAPPYPRWVSLGGAELNGFVAPPGPPRALDAGDVLRTGGDGSAIIVEDGAALFLPRHSAVTVRDELPRYGLTEGAVVATGQALKLVASGAEVSVSGRALLTLEPPEGLGRVTEALNQPDGDPMKSAWMRWGPVAATAVASSAVTLFVVEGSARVRPSENADPIEVQAGESWSTGKARPSRFAEAPKLAQGDAVQPSERRPARVEPDPVQMGPFAGLNREQLIATIEQLRDEREGLLREKHALKNALEAGRPPSLNYFHLTPEELAASAEKGELRLRLPQLKGNGLKYADEVRDEVGLRPDEEAEIKAIYARSSDRIRKGLGALYREIGGDGSLAESLGIETLLSELRSKSLAGDFERAIRTITRERAGIVPAGAPGEGPAVLRAYRLLWQEDDRVVLELERLLGATRAEKLLNHPKTSHSDNTYGVGPEKPR